ncbi:cistern family PEP-CTERM protein [Limnoraphis robusta Tam1]|uniref:Cistern family PEP-CTERM protein n=1 Tax=Limnoraphis robusta CCNP1315 TaxID=3110306 RepID=A0ABU5U0U0_9CYAN|nr:cistern family PEP-CTERM protein [Limnoraphis robusta]MEA5499089.1 cistern family PEP-CTERM protein [Limnoraphis robusta BA-68 BA1]MEA5520675.1 cistern family PEP-CTERM protein [Limnoraphis robusta CCNP1315]MEA5542142.1 cistern family PEP-CTERM protein [Limnoraphis robusta Tam1]MEA5545344.1 cistern family PEP-CTERM protein [Limnoraphis robusta CCNP1324]
MKTPFLISGIFAAAATTVFAATTPAFAFNVAPNGSSVGVNSGDIGDFFEVNFDGNVEENDVEGLSGQALFRLDNWGLETIGGNQYTIASFFVNLTNTSTNPISSRISRLGFDTDPNIDEGASSVNGTFNVISDEKKTSFPNGVGAIEVCLIPGTGSCEGGPGGVDTGETGTFNLKLAFANTSLTSLNLSNFHLRYQSITGTTFGTSGTGDGKVIASSTDAPEPLTILGTAIALGFGGVFHKEQQKQKLKQQVKA